MRSLVEKKVKVSCLPTRQGRVGEWKEQHTENLVLCQLEAHKKEGSLHFMRIIDFSFTSLLARGLDAKMEALQ